MAATANVQVQGLAVMNNRLLFTNPASHKIQMIQDDNIVDVAGSGDVGSMDGPVAHCQFGQPAGVCVENDCNIYVTDAQEGIA